MQSQTTLQKLMVSMPYRWVKNVPISTPKILWKWKSEKFILVLFDDTSSSSKFMNENEENKKTLAKMTFYKDGIL